MVSKTHEQPIIDASELTSNPLSQALGAKSSWYAPAPYRGTFKNADYGTITITVREGKLWFNLQSSEVDPDLTGLLLPWSRNVMAVCEIPALGYREYEEPVMKFRFVPDDEAEKVTGFWVNLDEESEPVLFEKLE
ncbi:hypothetical protein HDU99_007737 [Rhizoclosmatium hyalinum]|nr:hypothetical protein HDU99_007737 [Rhizoclosmatium hyalinum]